MECAIATTSQIPYDKNNVLLLSTSQIPYDNKNVLLLSASQILYDKNASVPSAWNLQNK